VFFQFASEKGLEYSHGWLKANEAEAAVMGKAQQCRRANKQAERRAAVAEKEEQSRRKKGQFSFVFIA